MELALRIVLLALSTLATVAMTGYMGKISKENGDRCVECTKELAEAWRERRASSKEITSLWGKIKAS